jgi:hypothetical protein
MITLLLLAGLMISSGLLLAVHPRAAIAQDDQPQAVAAAPDLIIESITLDPPNPGAGGTADIVIVVKNQGDAATATAFNLYLYVEPVDEVPTQSTSYTIFASYALPLPPNGTFKYTRTGQTFANTPPRVFAWVDPPWENKVSERRHLRG